MTDAALDLLYSQWIDHKQPLDTIEFPVSVAEDEDFFVMIRDKACYVYVNGVDARYVKGINKPWQSFGGSHVFNAYMSESTEAQNIVRIQYPGWRGSLAGVLSVYVYKKASKLTDWAFCVFKEGVPYEGRDDFENSVVSKPELLVPDMEITAFASDFRPKWYTTSFRRPETDAPLMLMMGNMNKGQIFLNGRNAGRFCGSITQSKYYLPAAWLQDENVLSIFEEYGNHPQQVRLVTL